MTKNLLPFLFIICFSCFFSACEEDEVDPCDTIFCSTGGDCVDGTCVCKDGFSGFSCETESVPQKVILKGVSTLMFPELNNGSSWDNDPGPDLFLIIRDLRGNIFFEETSHTTDCMNGTNVIHNIDRDVELTPQGRFRFELYDHDGMAQREFVGALETVPYIEGEKFPRNKVVSFENISFRVFYEYEF